MNVAVSIIVPMYKVEKYVNQCVDSILAQTLDNIEIILINDGSPDRCDEIAEDYAAKDRRIKVVHQPNGGLSNARNTGVRRATGEYVGFVDPDDWIEPEMFSMMYQAAKEADADTVICGLKEFYEGTGATATVLYPFLPAIINGRQAVREKVLIQILSGKLHAFAWNKLYKRSVILEKKITSPEDMPLMQDTVFAMRVFSVMERTCYIDKPLYHFRRHSASNSMKFRPDIFDTLLRLLHEKESCMRSNGFTNEELKTPVYAWFVRQILNATFMEFSKTNSLPFSKRIQRINRIVHHQDTRNALRIVHFDLNLFQRAAVFFFRRRNTASVILISVLYNKYLSMGRKAKTFMHHSRFLKVMEKGG